MVGLKAVVFGVAGAVAGFVVGFIAAMVIGGVVGLVTWDSKNGNAVALVVLWAGILTGAIIGFMNPIMAEAAEAKARREREEAEATARREREQAEADQRAAELRRLESDKQHRIFAAIRLCSDAQAAALTLPILLAEASLYSTRAEEELKKKRYSPFWEAVEDSTARLHAFEQTLHQIAESRVEYEKRATALEGLVPGFSLGNVVLPDAEALHDELRNLYLRAQENPDFANIYEHRRTAAKLDKTNFLLVAGFRSLNDAIHGLGDRIEGAVADLGASLDYRLGSIEESLEAAAETAAEQRVAILAQVQRVGDSNAETQRQLQIDSERRTEHERSARRMLDNIQRKRKPGMFESP
jgi:hypothetical protein